MDDLGRGVKLITRSEWGARAPRDTTPMTPTFGVTVHWEGPTMGQFPHSACDDKVRSIQRYHMDMKGWDDIAYSAVVCPHGFVFEGRWLGNRTAANGTDTGNDTAYALCWLGGQGDPFTEAGKIATRAAADWLDAHGRAGPGRNCHRDWKSTECPGDVICSWVRAGLPAGTLEPEDDDMPLNDTDREWIADTIRAELRRVVQFLAAGQGNTLTGGQPWADDAVTLPAIAERTIGRLNIELDPKNQGTRVRRTLLEMAERGVDESLRDGGSLDLRLKELAPPGAE